jgi:hypothetical protein
MLLRGFAPADDPDRVWQVRIDDESEPVRVAPKKTAVVTHYYTLFRDRPHKDDNWFWEDLFADWEDKAATAIRDLETRPDRIGKPAQLLVVLQLLRTPLGQALLAEQAAAERRRVFGAGDERVWGRWWIERTRRLPELWEWRILREAAEAARAGGSHPLLEADVTTILDEMMLVVRHSGFGERLSDGGDWNVLNDPQGRFVIGDEPVTYLGQDNPARPIWAQEQLPEQLTMPLPPTRCIEVGREKRLHDLTEAEIEAIDLRAFEWANRFVYGPDPEWLCRLRALWRERGSPSPPPRDRGSRRHR